MTDRRLLLKLATAAVGTQWLARSAWSQPRVGHHPFTLGLASGSPQSDSVVLWTRLMPPPRLPAAAAFGSGPLTVRWELALDDQFRRIVRQGQALALPELAHSVHVEVDGLAPDTHYFYRFLYGPAGQDWGSTPGRTRTLSAPDAPVQKLRLAYASCQRWEHGYYSAYRHMLADAPDFVVFLGDYIYEYPNATDAVRRPDAGWVQTLADYRQRYALHKSDSNLQEMHAACPWFTIWDDHEVQNDYAGMSAGDSGPTVADFAARRAAACQAFYEHMPLPASVLTRSLQGLGTGAELRIHTQLRFGRLAQLLLLDARQHKDEQACRSGSRASGSVDPAACAALNDPNRTMLGAPQEAWLAEQLGRSTSRWNVIGQPSLFGQRNFRSKDKPLYWSDGWDGYPAARRRLLDALRQPAATNPVILSGDVHENWVGHVKRDYDDAASANVGVEFCGTSITSRSYNDHARAAAWRAGNPHFVFADTARRGYGLADFTPARLTTTLRVVNDVTLPEAGVETLATFEVAAGRSQIERV